MTPNEGIADQVAPKDGLIAELRDALQELVEAYVGVAKYYEDWGAEEAEAEGVVMRARAVLTKAGVSGASRVWRIPRKSMKNW